MKLLFIIDTVEYPLAPTPALARRVAGMLARRGHAVHLLELWDGRTPPPEQAGCTRTLLRFDDERVMDEILEHGRKGGTPVPKRLAKLALHPAAALAAVRKIGLKKSRRISAAKSAIEDLDRQQHFDAAISVSAPFASAFALEQARIGARKASWQMDPYAGNLDYQAAGGWDREKQLLEQLDRVFVAPAMADYYAPGAPLEAYRDKMQVLDFPSLTELPSLPKAESDGLLNCVFVGSLYPKLRTPHYALELFRALDSKQVRLVFVGGGWENYPADLPQPCRRALGDRLVITGPLPKVKADEWLARADVLVSLGNGVANQVPSKIFEYFAAGKPVLHLAKLADDPCLAYFDRWPLALTLLESEGTGPEICRRLSDFLAEKGRSRLTYADACRLYRENTPQYAAELLESKLKE